MRRLLAVVAMLALAAGAWHLTQTWLAERALLARLEQRVSFPATGIQPCPAASANRLVILALGQSNAGNHGAEELPAPTAASPTVLVSNGRACVRTGDPLPGATGRHRSLWTQVAADMRVRGDEREIVFMPLAVEATMIADWTRAGSPLRAALQLMLEESAASGLRPDLIVWQQGEADARRGTTKDEYVPRFEALISIVRGAGVEAPFAIALSTRCGKGGPSDVIRSALAEVASARRGVTVGPDTDAIGNSMRNGDCHFSAHGLAVAADMWARALVDLLPRARAPADVEATRAPPTPR